MIEHFSIQRTQLSSGEGNHKVTRKKTTKNLLIEDSPAFFSQLENSCQPEKKKKAFTQSVRTNELLFSALEKKYTINHAEI